MLTGKDVVRPGKVAVREERGYNKMDQINKNF